MLVSQKAKSVTALRKGPPLVALSRIPVIKTERGRKSSRSYMKEELLHVFIWTLWLHVMLEIQEFQFLNHHFIAISDR